MVSTMVGTMPLAAASAVCSAAALGLLGCGCLCGVGRWRRQYTWDHAIALRGVILAHPVPQVRCLIPLPIGGYFS